MKRTGPSTLALIGITTWIALAAPATAAPAAAYAAGLTAGAGGRLVGAPWQARTVTPPAFEVEVLAIGGDPHRLAATLALTDPAGHRQRVEGVPGHVFLATASGHIVSLESIEPGSVPDVIRVLDAGGRLLLERPVWRLTDPQLSPDRRWLAYRTARATEVLDLDGLAVTRHPRLARFAVGPEGRLVGAPAADPMPLPRRLAFTADGQQLLVLGAARLEAFAGVTTGWPPRTPARTLFEAPAGVELTDLIVLADRLVVGLRERDGATVRGATVTLDGAGHVLSRAAGAEHHVAGHRVAERAAAAAPAGRHAPIPWPIVPNSQHPVGNTWGEYQNYGGSPYPHPGVDVLGDPGQPVYAVREGVVKAILTTSGDWHWRIAIGDTASAATVSGYLYAHIDEPTITVQVGDPVVQGQYLGDLVPWPVYDFTHCHFARIEDSGAVWLGDWLATENPHLDLPAQTETEPPVFEPAYGSNLLAFCQNQTSNYLDPAALSGAVDIIAHVGDRILTDWVCTVQTLRYSIHPLGQPAFPVVDERLAVEFDMALDTYQNGPNDPFLVDLLYKQDTTCRTEGDYEAREFYHIITNSNGDTVYEESDLWEAWDTSTLPDGAYVVRVTAIDVAGNAAVDSMVVGTANGNPAAIDPVTDPRPLPPLAIRGVHPNPALAASTITFALGQTGPVALAVYDPAGRLVRRLAAGRLAAGTHSLGWDGTDAYGRRVGSGVYFYALETPVARRVHKLVVSR